MTDTPENLKEKIVTLKNQGHLVEKVTLCSHDFIYRSLNRKEFRDLQKQVLSRATEDDDLMAARDEGQDDVVARALVEPQVTSKLELSGLPAGTVDTLFNLIMRLSGFNPSDEEIKPQRL